MTWFQRLHLLHRALRYRLRTERAELRFVLRRDYHGGTILDIGAHRGVYSFWLHRWFRGGARVIAFEPQPELVDELAELKQAFHLDRLVIEPLGLSSTCGTLTMCRPRAHWGGATVSSLYEGVDADLFEVPVTTIDEYLDARPELRPVRFIKCDVEAHEVEVLAGAAHTLREDRPEVLVEWTTTCLADRERFLSLTQRLGYHVFQFVRGQLEPCTTAERNRPASWELGGNYVLLPQEKAAAAA